MVTDLTEHPDAPDVEELGDFVVEPVPLSVIERRREAGEELVEDNLLEREDLNIHIPRDKASDGREVEQTQDVGTYLYRFTQLFGSPQIPEFFAGENIDERTNETFKYLLRVDAPPENDDFPDEWLITVFDWKVDLGVGVAEWHEEPGTVEADELQALASLQLAHNIASEPVECVYEDIWY